MTYLGPLRGTPTWRNPYDRFCFLYADTEDELHAMAGKLDVPGHAFQRTVPISYKLSCNKRQKALRLGVMPVSDAWIRERYLEATCK